MGDYKINYLKIIVRLKLQRKKLLFSAEIWPSHFALD